MQRWALSTGALLVIGPAVAGLALSGTEGSWAIPKGRDRPAVDQRSSGKLSPETRLLLVRELSGEFSRAKIALPAGKKPVQLEAGKPLNEAQLKDLIARNGISVNPGDTAQITKMSFGNDQIVFEINGGGKRKKRWYNRVEIGVGPTTRPISRPSEPGLEPHGCAIVLKFPQSVPEVTSVELKQHLSALLDFSGQRTAAAMWIESLPKEFQEAIKNREAKVGMTEEMVFTAVGRPDRKVRELREGVEEEDWIYGNPPSKVTFITFRDHKVVRIQEFP